MIDRQTMWPNKTRGAALVIAVVFTLIMSALVVSYLMIVKNELKASYRFSLFLESLNLAESGVEEVAWALNNNDWTDWDETGIYKERILDGFNLSANKTGSVTIIVEDFANDPTVYAEGHVQTVGGDEIKKQIEVKLTRRSLFANGLTAKDLITFMGANATVDSFNSNDGPYDPFFNRGANATVGSLSVGVSAINVQNANIFGYVATGGGEVGLGPNGFVSDLVDPPVHDPNRITNDFKANFKEIVVPVLTSPTTTLPGGNVKTIGTPAASPPDEFEFTDLDLSSNEKLIIDGPVVIVVNDDVDVKGEIEVTANGSVTFYVEGDFSVGGGSANINNTNAASAFVIYGTYTTPGDQEITLAGSGDLNAAVYAPNASLELKGGGGTGVFAGACVAYDVSFNGTYSFHYDEALSDFFGSDPSFKMVSYRELEGNDRIDFATYINP